MDVERAGGATYAAFISYSHKDAAFGRWLHRKLEGYRLPGRLAGSEGERGPVPARLTPIFRDREELPAAGDLSERVRAALAVSGSLIVVCSPNAAASPWVAKEIATFHSLHPDRPVLAAILDGDPADCFPPEIRRGASSEIEPLAADFRKDRDGRRLGLLKLVAGVAGIGLDRLVQRDAQRRIRSVTAVTLAALLGMLVTATLAIVAINARAEAQRQRGEAEGLVEFMLTDLRDRLKGVGRLDVLTAVNQRALGYYQKQNIGQLSVDSLERRARILHAMGEDDQKRELYDRALSQFREAARITSVLLAAQPDDPERIFNHAQSEFWIGSVDYNRGRFNEAKPAFERYRALTYKLIDKNSRNATWLEEAAYADGNLCTISLANPHDTQRALSLCSSALAKMIEVRRIRGSTPETIVAVANREAWMVKALAANGRWQHAANLMTQHEADVARLIKSDPQNADYREIWMTAQSGFAAILADHGQIKSAEEHIRQAEIAADSLSSKDPQNTSWTRWRNQIRLLSERIGRSHVSSSTP